MWYSWVQCDSMWFIIALSAFLLKTDKHKGHTLSLELADTEATPPSLGLASKKASFAGTNGYRGHTHSTRFRGLPPLQTLTYLNAGLRGHTTFTGTDKHKRQTQQAQRPRLLHWYWQRGHIVLTETDRMKPRLLPLYWQRPWLILEDWAPVYTWH